MLYSCGYIRTDIEISHSRQAKKVMELINWLNENFTEPISLDKLSEQTGLSEKYICRIFKERLGIPGNAVYITYQGINDWGWDGRNF